MKKSYVLSVIAVLLVVGIGFSFAYFVSGIIVGGEGSSVTVKTDPKFIQVIYDAGEETLSGDGLLPGNSVSKDFTVTIIPTEEEKTATYAIYLDLTNTGQNYWTMSPFYFDSAGRVY